VFRLADWRLSLSPRGYEECKRIIDVDQALGRADQSRPEAA
jgi:hypothetical protein